jgi:hypothetical protein
MRMLVDEDTAVQIIGPLRHVLIGHEVVHGSELSWKGKKDIRVLPDARNAGFHALITRDRAQFSHPRECDAIKKSGAASHPLCPASGGNAGPRSSHRCHHRRHAHGHAGT